MKIYLLNPPYIEKFVRCGRWQGVCARGKTLYYPIWLAYATGVLESKGHEVRLIDAIAKKWGKIETLEDIKKFNPEILVVDTNFSSMESDVKLASEAKKLLEGKPKTVITGPPAAVYFEKMLRELGADIVARKEIDFTLLEIADAISGNMKLEDVRGISFVKNGKIFNNADRPFIESEELDKIPFVSQVYKKHLNSKDYWLDHTLNPMVQIMTSRGCPNMCTFCSWPENMMGRKFRARSVKNIADEVEWVSENMPEIKEIFFEDDAFTIDRRRVLEFCDEVKKRKLKFVWSCQSRVTLDFETMKEMKKAGCRLLDVGFESGSDVVLKNIKKGTTVERARKFAKDAKKVGLMILADFVLGFTGETKETIEQTRQFIKEIRPNLLQISIATPIPGTKFYEYVEQNGYLLEKDPSKSIDDKGFQKCLISYPGLTDKDLEEAVSNTLREYYLNVSYVPVAMSNILRKNGIHELKGMIESARMFFKYVGNKK